MRKHVSLNRMPSDYYVVRGWDEFGRPAEATLRRLGLAVEN